MKAAVFKGVGDIKVENVKEPVIEKPTDALVKITTSAICGTDLHIVRGSLAGMKKGTILGHEGIGIVEKIGDEVKHIKVGDRVIITSTIACGYCHYCKKQVYSQCDNANPHGPDSGPVFFGGPQTTGPFNGLQAEKARIPYADVGLIKIPHELSDEQVILLSDIFPTAYMGADMAELNPRDSVAVFGCGPVGQLVIASLKILGIKHILAIDYEDSRLAMAQKQGADIINFNKHDVVTELKSRTNNRGPERIIDAVGVDSEQPQCCGIPFFKGILKKAQFKLEQSLVAPKTNPHNNNWYPGNAPSQVLNWAVQSVAKAGLISIIGVYPPTMNFFPIGISMSKNLTIKLANCDHKKYVTQLLDMVKNGNFDTTQFISHILPFDKVIDGYKHFDKRDKDWIKVILKLD